MSPAPRLLTARQAKRIDIRAAADYGISPVLLMENAGRQVADEAMRFYRGHKKIAVFCGRGNNGGDGFVAARQILARGVRPDVYLAGKISDVRDEARINLGILLKLKHRVIEVTSAAISRIETRPYGLIIDALLGIGLTGEVRGIYKSMIALVNASGARILSVDIPSGLDATTGKILGCCVKADRTITFVAKKRGMVVGYGPRVCGTVTVADIGVPL